MRLYTGELKYDVIGYDKKDRLLSGVRKINREAWGKRWENCYFAFTKCTQTHIDCVAAVSGKAITEKELRSHLDLLRKSEYTRKEICEMYRGWKCYQYNIEHFFPCAEKPIRE